MPAKQPVRVQSVPLALLVQIVNQWRDAPRPAGHGDRKPSPTVASLHTENPEFWDRIPAVDERTLVETANLLYPVFASTTGAECAERLNALTRATGLMPAFAAEDWMLQEAWCTTRPDRALLAGTVLSLVDHLRREPDGSRLGICSGDDCAATYIDQSPAGRRQYCCLTCQNRARTRAYRASKKEASEVHVVE